MLATFAHDLRHCVRRLARMPGFTIAAIAMLALGIAFSVTMFCTLYGVLLRGLPFPHAESLVLIEARSANQHVEQAQLSAPEAERVAAGTPGFDALAYFVYWSETEDAENAHPRDLTTQKVGAGFFDALGMQPLLGRTFTADEVRDDKPVTVLSYDEWQRVFGGATDVIGKRVRLANRPPLEVIGVMQKAIDVFVGDVALWRPYAPAVLQQDMARRLNQRFLRVVGRLHDGVSAAQADAALAAQAAALRDANGLASSDWQLRQRPLLDLLVGDVRAALWGAFAIAVLVLLIAAANVAILLDARQTARRHEQAVMQAIGADPKRIRRALLLELSLLALAASLIALALARLGIGVLRELARDSVPRVDEIGIDAGVLGFALLLGVVAPLAAVATGALRVHASPSEAIRGGGKRLLGRGAPRRALPAVAMALSTLSLVAALGFAAALWKLQQVEPGFRSAGVHALQVFHAAAAPAAELTFAAQVQERLAALPGTRAVAVTSVAPLSVIGQATIELQVAGRAADEPQQVAFRRVSPAYRALLGIALGRGRDFSQDDRAGGEAVAIINRSAAARVFGETDPLGQQISLPLQREQRVACRIVAIVDDIRNDGLRAPAQPEVWVPYAQFPSVAMTFLVAADAALAGVDAQIADALWAVDAHQSIARQYTLADDLAQETRPARFFARTVGAFALAALLLAVLGVYAVASLQQQQRVGEFGLRLAIGAPPRSLALAVLGDSVKASAFGVAAGLAGAWFVLRILQARAFDLDANQLPLLLAAGLGAMTLAALLAALLPAWRAARIDPNVALRQE